MGSAVLKGFYGAGCLLAWLLLNPPLWSDIPSESSPLDAIEVRGGFEPFTSELRRVLELELGKPATAERVRRTLLRVRALRLASDAAVYLRRESGKTIATLVLWPETRVDRIIWEGAWPFSAAVLEGRVPQRAGEPLREDRVLQGLYTLEKFLEEEGYLGARIQIQLDPVNKGASQPWVNLIYALPATPRWTVGAVELLGAPEETRRGLERQLRLRPTATYRPSWVAEDRERLRAELARRGYRRAKVALEREERHAETHQVDLIWRVVSGPKVEIEVVGLDRRTVEKKGLIAMAPTESIDETSLRETAARLRTYLEQRGHYRAEVERKELVSDHREWIRFELQPGPRYTLAEVRFPGAAQVPSSELQARMKTSPRNPLRPGSGRLVHEELNADLSNLRSYLALEGFLDARVGPPRVVERGRQLILEVPIEEGMRRRVGTVELVGVESLDPALLLTQLSLRSGGPFHRLRVERAVEELRSAYENAGFPAVQVGARVEWLTPSVAKVTLHVVEGRKRQPGKLLLAGLRRTKPEVVHRLVDRKLGPPFSEATRLELQRALYQLGIFSKAEVRWLEEASGAGPSDLIADCEEAKTGAVAWGVGYDSESGLRGSLRVSESNFLGRLIALRLDALVAESDQLYRFSIKQPYLGMSRFQAEAVLFRERQDRAAFDVARRGAQFVLLRRENDWQATLAYEYRNVRLEGVRDEASIPRESRTAQVASLVASYFLDRRDDPIDPQTGWSAFFQVERAFPLLQAKSEFWKGFFQWTWLHPVGPATAATSLRVGGLENLRKPLPDGTAGIDLVPASERFFAGGRTTHRAFPRDELGILGSTLGIDSSGAVLPLGGGATLLWNLDLRFPIFGALGGTVFVDGGQVWRGWSDVRGADLRWGAGVGLRYPTPIGPIRLEVGWNLDRLPFEDSPVWFLSLGNPF